MRNNEALAGDTLSGVGILRCAATGAATLFVLYLICWLGAASNSFALSHMYLSIFTTNDVSTINALLEGLCWSVVFGALAGALAAIFYGFFKFLRAR